MHKYKKTPTHLLVFAGIVISLLVTLACGISVQLTDEPPTAVPTQPAANTPQYLPEATETVPIASPEPDPAEAAENSPPPEWILVNFEGIQFSYPPNFVVNVLPEITPSEAPEDPWAVPQHYTFKFEDYVHQGTFHSPQIKVFPVAEYNAVNPISIDVVNEMQKLLRDKPENPEVIPFLPNWNAAQMIRSKVQYLDFQNGSGVRFLSQYGQAASPINNNDLFYTFQGLTANEQYYVSVVLPVSNPILPNSVDEVPNAFSEEFLNNFMQYSQEIQQQLNEQPDQSFTPPLEVLDSIMRTIQINK